MSLLHYLFISQILTKEKTMVEEKKIREIKNTILILVNKEEI